MRRINAMINVRILPQNIGCRRSFQYFFVFRLLLCAFPLVVRGSFSIELSILCFISALIPVFGSHVLLQVRTFICSSNAGLTLVLSAIVSLKTTKLDVNSNRGQITQKSKAKRHVNIAYTVYISDCIVYRSIQSRH